MPERGDGACAACPLTSVGGASGLLNRRMALAAARDGNEVLNHQALLGFAEPGASGHLAHGGFPLAGGVNARIEELVAARATLSVERAPVLEIRRVKCRPARAHAGCVELGGGRQANRAADEPGDERSPEQDRPRSRHKATPASR